MPYVIRYMKERKIVGIDAHKLEKPEIAEMGGVGLIIGVTFGCFIIFIIGGIITVGVFDLRIMVFLSVILLAGCIGIIDDLKPLGAKVKPILTAVASLPILLYTWVIVGLGLSPPLKPAYDPGPYLPFLGKTRLTIIYPLLVPVAIAVTSNAVNMIDVFNGVMPLSTILMFIALLIVSLVLLTAGVPGAELGVLFSCIMIGALIAYYFYNRNPARVFAGDTGSLFVGAALGVVAVMGRVEIMAIIALLPAIMNAFYSLVSIGGLLERRQMKTRPTFLQDNGTIAASHDPGAPLTLTRLVLARGSLREQQITLSLAVLTLASSVLAILTIFLIPFDTGYFLIWPFTLILLIIPICLIMGIFVVLRTQDKLGIRLGGLVTIMVGVWTLGMMGFALLDFLISSFQSAFWPIAGIAFLFAWLGLWHFATRLFFRFELARAEPMKPKPLTT